MNFTNLLNYPQISYGAGSSTTIIDQGLSGGLLPPGQYAFAVARDDSIYLARDPIGSNKLFYGYNSKGQFVAGSRLVHVWRCGIALDDIRSCPPGRVLAIVGNDIQKVGGADLSSMPPDTNFDLGEFRAGVRWALTEVFNWLAHEFENHRIVVCLSGGLDSSVVASLARASFANVTAACFTYLDPNDVRFYALGTTADNLASASEDFRCARRVAESLDMPLLAVVRSREAVASAVTASVRLCQDWRDFNVHCATVNLFLAQDIRAAFPNEKIVVLTGDLMNEYVCDYHTEQVGDRAYYKIPRIPVDKRRKHFVRGLDSSDREIGVFWAYGLTVCQPFAAVADRYMRIPAAVLEQPDVKWELNGSLLSPAVSAYVSREKTRAQVGGKDLGTLGI